MREIYFANPRAPVRCFVVNAVRQIIEGYRNAFLDDVGGPEILKGGARCDVESARPFTRLLEVVLAKAIASSSH